jgi:hypothetical protein
MSNLQNRYAQKKGAPSSLEALKNIRPDWSQLEKLKESHAKDITQKSLQASASGTSLAQRNNNNASGSPGQTLSRSASSSSSVIAGGKAESNPTLGFGGNNIYHCGSQTYSNTYLK